MSTTPFPHVQIDRDRVLEDERTVAGTTEPQRVDEIQLLGRDLEVPEADAIAQRLVVRVDDDEQGPAIS